MRIKKERERKREIEIVFFGVIKTVQQFERWFNHSCKKGRRANAGVYQESSLPYWYPSDYEEK